MSRFLQDVLPLSLALRPRLPSASAARSRVARAPALPDALLRRDLERDRVLVHERRRTAEEHAPIDRRDQRVAHAPVEGITHLGERLTSYDAVSGPTSGTNSPPACSLRTLEGELSSMRAGSIVSVSAQVKPCELDAVIVAGNRLEDVRRDRRLRICFGVRADWMARVRGRLACRGVGLEAWLRGVRADWWDSLAPTSEGLCRGV